MALVEAVPQQNMWGWVCFLKHNSKNIGATGRDLKAHFVHISDTNHKRYPFKEMNSQLEDALWLFSCSGTPAILSKPGNHEQSLL